MTPAILKKMVDGVRDGSRLPQAAENVLKIGEAGDRYRAIDRALQCPTNKGCDGSRYPSDRV